MGMVTSAPLSNVLRFRSDPIGFLSCCARTGERITTINLSAGTAYYLVNEPDLIAQLLQDKKGRLRKHLLPGIGAVFGNGLLNSDGEVHRSVREAVQPAFHRCQIAQWKEAMNAIVEEMVAHLTHDQEMDVKKFFEHLTLVAVGRILFALDLRSAAGEFFDCLELMQQLFLQSEASPAASERFVEASQRLDALILRTLREQAQAPIEGPLFSYLTDAGDIDEAQLMDELRNFLLAGTMTTSLLLATSCWLLARYPEEQDRLRKSDGGVRLQYVLSETLRLYPPVWLMMRGAVEPLELDRTCFAAGSRFLICPWTLHRSPNFFPEPERFWPDRWHLKSDLPRGAYIPFSLGARNCVGERFARTLAEETFRHLLKRFAFSPVERQKEIRWLPRITLWPDAGIWVKFLHYQER